MFRNERDTYKYRLIRKGKVVHRGISYDLSRTEAIHQREWPASHVRQIGRKTTRKAALKWERRANRRHRETPSGRRAICVAYFLAAIVWVAALVIAWGPVIW